MTNSIKLDTINSLIAISYYWMGEDNPQSALSIIKLLYELKMTTVQGKKVDDAYSDFKTFFKGKYNEKTHVQVKIPNEYTNDEDKKLLWISSTIILNLFSAGLFEVAYTSLMEISINWNELYIHIINNIKDKEFMPELADWLFAHFFMALDIYGKKEIESLGYIVKKLDD